MGSRRISSAMASRSASRTVMVVVAAGERRLGSRLWRRRCRRGLCRSGCWRRRGNGALAAGALAAALASRLRPPDTAIGVLTFTFSVPAGTRIFRSLPSSTASTSIVALSVSISAMTSPELDRVALGFQPFGQLALGHGRRQRRHQDFNRHGKPLRAAGPRSGSRFDENVGVQLGRIGLGAGLRELGRLRRQRP